MFPLIKIFNDMFGSTSSHSHVYDLYICGFEKFVFDGRAQWQQIYTTKRYNTIETLKRRTENWPFLSTQPPNERDNTQRKCEIISFMDRARVGRFPSV